MKNILHIVGNRPQFIKLAPLLRAASRVDSIRNVIVHSGQHYDFEMSKAFFLELDLPDPDYNLDVGSGSHGEQTGKIMSRLDGVLAAEDPDMVAVYGDTNTTLAGALCAYKLHYPLAHVESGLREYVWRPEEINRKLTDHCSDLLFCPTETAVRCLKKEGLEEDRILLTGDITYDAFRWARERIWKESASSDRAGYALVTLHRAESVDHPDILAEIVEALTALPDPILFPVHPRTRKFLEEFGLLKKLESSPRVTLTPAVSYMEFIRRLLPCAYVITDSGGVIKEAFYAAKPCIVIDSTTEYVEIEKSGSHFWTGKRKEGILTARKNIESLTLDENRAESIFGRGDAADKMIAAILRFLSAAGDKQ